MRCVRSIRRQPMRAPRAGTAFTTVPYPSAPGRLQRASVARGRAPTDNPAVEYVRESYRRRLLRAVRDRLLRDL